MSYMGKKFTLEELEGGIRDMLGYCTCCGVEQGPLEPDARDVTCEACGAPAVYGAEELIIINAVKDDDDDMPADGPVGRNEPAEGSGG